MNKEEKISLFANRVRQVELWCRARHEFPMAVKWGFKSMPLDEYGETFIEEKPRQHARIELNYRQNIRELEDTAIHELCHVYLHPVEDLMGQDLHGTVFWWLYKKFYDQFYTEGGCEISKRL